MNLIKLKNTEQMLIDIYDEQVHKSEIVGIIYKEVNENPSREMPSINPTDEAFLKYVALMYDKNSPLKKQKLEERKRNAVIHAGFTSETAAKRAVEISDARIVMLVSLYLQYQHDFTWSHLITAEEMFFKNTKTLFSLDQSDVKQQEIGTKLLNSNSTIIETINRCRDEIFGDNKDKVELIEMFYVEDFADKLEDARKKRELKY